MKYFLHDTSAFEDEKISELFIHFGYEGIGLFFTTLEKLAKQEKPVKTEVLKHQLKVGKKLEKCWKFMEEIGLISSINGETFNEQLLNFSEKYKIKKEKNAKKISEWREKQSNTKNVTSYEHICNQPKVKESKEEEINSSSSVVDYNFILDSYHTFCDRLSKVSKLSDERKKHINARIREFDIDTVVTVFKKVGNSSFLNGDNDRRWKADFDWIFNPTNFLKILEGKYDKKEQEIKKSKLAM